MRKFYTCFDRSSKRHLGIVVSTLALAAWTVFSFGNHPSLYAETSLAPLLTDLHFSGNEPATTDTFTLEDGWEVTWKTESDSFQLSAYGVANLYEGVLSETEQVLRSFEVFEPIILANSADSSGTAFHPLGGTFYLKIVASGPWTVHLKPVKRTKDYLDVPYTGAP